MAAEKGLGLGNRFIEGEEIHLQLTGEKKKKSSKTPGGGKFPKLRNSGAQDV